MCLTYIFIAQIGLIVNSSIKVFTLCRQNIFRMGDLMYTLKIGDTGAIVAAMQLALKRASFYSGLTDGVFGRQTQQAVVQFQRSNRINPDGIIGPQTEGLLQKYIKGYFKYTLRRGDTYWLLANKYGTSAKAIMQANPNINQNFLRIGQVINIPYGFSVVPSGIAYSYYLLQLLLDGLKTRYPFLNVFSVGQSEMGKELYCLKMGAGKKELFVSAAHHANEWITTPVVLKFTEQYANAYSLKDVIDIYPATELFDNVTLCVVPLVNPDGVDLVTGALKNGMDYENAVGIGNNYPNIPFPAGWKANIKGTDLNLNYPAEWEKAKEIKFAQGFISPAPRDFVGTAPLSAKESRAIYDYTGENDFKMILAYHTQGEIIFWKYLDYEPPKSLEIAKKLSSVSGYSLEITPESASYAGYKDWFIATFNKPGYTVECGRGVNPLPISQFDKIYRDNEPLLAASLYETAELQ